MRVWGVPDRWASPPWVEDLPLTLQLLQFPGSEHAALWGKAINHHYCCLLPLRLLGQSVSDPLIGHSALSHTLFHLSSRMKGIYEPVIPALHPFNVSDWYSVPVDWLLLIFLPWKAVTFLSTIVQYRNNSFQCIYGNNKALWADVRKHVRRCVMCSILPLAAVTEKQDWRWCWWVMVYVNGWMGLIGISRSATAACHSETAMWMGPKVYGNINWTALTWSRTFWDSGSQRNCLVNIQSNVNGWTSISSITDFAWSLWIEVYWRGIEGVIKIHYVAWTISGLMWSWWDEWLMSVTILGIMTVEDRQDRGRETSLIRFQAFLGSGELIYDPIWGSVRYKYSLHCRILARFSLGSGLLQLVMLM